MVTALASDQHISRFPGLRFLICIASLDLPINSRSFFTTTTLQSLPSLHIAGEGDQNVSLDRSRALLLRYSLAESEDHSLARWMTHEQTGHCVPIKKPIIDGIVQFVQEQSVQ